jgi:hypothetical protein
VRRCTVFSVLALVLRKLDHCIYRLSLFRLLLDRPRMRLDLLMWCCVMFRSTSEPVFDFGAVFLETPRPDTFLVHLIQLGRGAP